MGVSVSSQITETALALALGAAAGVLYDVLRVARRSLRSQAVTMLLDGAFWLIAGLALFALGLSAGHGQQRLYSQVLAALGAALYFLTVSRFVVEAGDFLAGLAARAVRFCCGRRGCWERS